MPSGPDVACRARPVQIGEPDWQRLELGSFRRDIPVWIEIARASSGMVLELGAGAGRVTFPLLEEGFEVVAVEASEQLADQLRLDASSRGYHLDVVKSRIEEMDRVEPAPAVVIAPMQFIHYLDPDVLPAVLDRLGGTGPSPPTVAISLLRDDLLVVADLTPDALPQMKDQDDWVLSSRIIRMNCEPDRLTLVRRRESVGPEGEVWAEDVTETLWRLSAQRLINSMETAGYELSRCDTLPTEEGTTPADLLVFTAPRSEQRR